MRNHVKLAAAIGLLSLSSIAAEAKGLSPGQYSLGGLQSICLVGNGTWYGVTFGSWGGRWTVRTLGGVKTTFIYGNYASNVGNDSIIALGVANSKWTEWRDNFTFTNIINNLVITKQSNLCGPPAPAKEASAGMNPME